MRQPIQLTQTDVDGYASQAAALSDWLEEKSVQVASRVVIPPELVAVAPIVVVSGALLFLGEPSPTAVCWGGCVNSA
jgi:hypothetical protein